MGSSMIRVLVVDDQDIVRHGLGVILMHQPGIEVVGYAADGAEALDQVTHLQPAVVLMDLKMPRLNGIQATRRIVEKYPATKVVVLTTYDTDEWLFDAIRSGACGYLLKDSDSQAIVAAVRGAVAGETSIDPSVAGRVLQEFNRLASVGPSLTPAGSAGPMPAEMNTLTERELAILQRLAQGESNTQIAEALFLAEGTVKNYVSSIISKLQANDRTHAAVLALKHGLATLE
jgi:DNA-binding NarL/FixJ family response regulator